MLCFQISTWLTCSFLRTLLNCPLKVSPSSTIIIFLIPLSTPTSHYSWHWLSPLIFPCSIYHLSSFSISIGIEAVMDSKSVLLTNVSHHLACRSALSKYSGDIHTFITGVFLHGCNIGIIFHSWHNSIFTQYSTINAYVPSSHVLISNSKNYLHIILPFVLCCPNAITCMKFYTCPYSPPSCSKLHYWYIRGPPLKQMVLSIYQLPLESKEPNQRPIQ